MDEQADLTPTPELAAQPEFHSVLIGVEPSPKPKRGRVFATLAAVVLLIGGFVAYLALADDSSSAKYSLTAAVSGTQEAESIAYEMRMDMGLMGSMVIEGRFDAANERMAMAMSFAGVDMPAMEYLIDLETQTMYINAEALADSGLDVDTEWVAVDLSESSMMDDLGAIGSNPVDMASALADAEGVEDLGMETLDGVEVRHYRATVAIADALAANPTLQDQYDQVGAAMPDEIVYDVFVDESNSLRRMVFDLEMLGEKITFEMNITAIGDIEPIVLPDPSDVTEQDIPGL